MYRVLVIFEQGKKSYSAYAPDIPGCIATGRTQEEVEKNMREAIAMHIQGMIEDGEPIPTPSLAEYLEVSLPNSAA